MAKDKIAYVCSNCGQDSPKWIGKCPNCGQWNTFKEIRIAADTGQQAAKMAAQTVASTVHGKSRPVHLKDIASHEEPRLDLHDAERSHNAAECAHRARPLLREPQDALRHEIRQEGIERQQVGAALACRNAVEHEYNRHKAPPEHPDV